MDAVYPKVVFSINVLILDSLYSRTSPILTSFNLYLPCLRTCLQWYRIRQFIYIRNWFWNQIWFHTWDRFVARVIHKMWMFAVKSFFIGELEPVATFASSLLAIVQPHPNYVLLVGFANAAY